MQPAKTYLTDSIIPEIVLFHFSSISINMYVAKITQYIFSLFFSLDILIISNNKTGKNINANFVFFS